MSVLILILLASLFPQDATQVHLDSERWVVDAGSPNARSFWWWSAGCAPQKLSTGEAAHCGATRNIRIHVVDVKGHPVGKGVVVWATEPMLRDLPVRIAGRDRVGWELWTLGPTDVVRRQPLATTRRGPFGHMKCEGRGARVTCVANFPGPQNASKPPTAGANPRLLIFRLSRWQCDCSHRSGAR